MAITPTHAPADAAQDDGFVAFDACHRRLLATVGLLERLVGRLEAGELGADDRAEVAAAVAFIATEAPDHHRDEERLVFPALVARGDAETVQAVLRLRQDHGWLEEDWRELAPQLQALADGYGGWDPDVLRHGVGLYGALLRDHIALEEALVYPQARAYLGEEGRRAIGRELAAARRQARPAPNASEE